MKLLFGLFIEVNIKINFFTLNYLIQKIKLHQMNIQSCDYKIFQDSKYL